MIQVSVVVSLAVCLLNICVESTNKREGRGVTVTVGDSGLCCCVPCCMFVEHLCRINKQKGKEGVDSYCR